MTDITEGIILAIKHNYNNLDDRKECVRKFLSDYCACPIDVYTDKDILGILETAFCDYMTTCDKRYSILADYFHCKHDPYMFEKYKNNTDIEIYSILSAFQAVMVRQYIDDKIVYVNGFKNFNYDNRLVLELN